MPPKISLLSNSIFPRIPSTYICLQCRFHTSTSFRRRNFNALLNSFSWPQVKHQRAASTASTTAIDARREIPPLFQDLHASLSALKDEVFINTDSSQLQLAQLALRGLESENVLTRVAVLGINEHHGARRLARALLADPLRQESEWERQLLGEDDGDSRSLLIRYGEEPNIDQRHPLIKTLSLPIPSLLAHNLEIFIRAVPEISDVHSTEPEAATFLVPNLELNSGAGRIQTSTFPVHRSVVFVRGLPKRSILPSYMPGQMIKGLIDGSWTSLQEGPDSGQALNLVNLDLAESAISSFRQSLENSLVYEHGWFGSGLADVSAWFFNGLNEKGSSLKLSLRHLVETCCDNAEQAIIQQELSDSKQRAIITIPFTTRDSLDNDITRWAEFAHTELRDQLDRWFRSGFWKRTTWWKLFWRVDDIVAITSIVLERGWLFEAEKGMILFYGRLEQAGLKDPEEQVRRPVAKLELPIPVRGVFPGRPLIPGLIPPPINERNQDSNRPVPFGSLPRPWPQGISDARTILSMSTIPPLEALAQRLLLETFSTTLLTSCLSALVYVSLSSPSVYEVGTIAALGLVYSVRRLQGRWGLARESWIEKVREDGVRVLRDTEAQMRSLVREGGKINLVDRTEERNAARRVVENVRRALQAVS